MDAWTQSQMTKQYTSINMSDGFNEIRKASREAEKREKAIEELKRDPDFEYKIKRKGFLEVGIEIMEKDLRNLNEEIDKEVTKYLKKHSK